MNLTIESDQTPPLVEQFVPRANEGGARGAALRDKIRRALDNSYFFGEDAEWLKRELWDRLDLAPESRIFRVHAAIAEMAAVYVGSDRSVAKLIVKELNDYGGSCWRRKDKTLAAAPVTYGRRAALKFTILKDSGGEDGVPSERQIRRILGQNGPAAMAQKSAHPSIEDQTKDRATMNAMTPNSDKKLLEVLRRSPVVEEIISSEAFRAKTERQKLLDAIATLDADAARAAPALEKAVQAAIAGVKAAEKDLRAANDRLHVAYYAKSGASCTYTTKRERIEMLLREGVDAKVFDQFFSDMIDELDSSRKQFGYIIVTIQDRVTKRRHEQVYNNSDSVNARVAAINSAMEEAESLRLAADQSVVAARLAALRAGLPKIEPVVLPAVDGKE